MKKVNLASTIRPVPSLIARGDMHVVCYLPNPPDEKKLIDLIKWIGEARRRR